MSSFKNSSVPPWLLAWTLSSQVRNDGCGRSVTVTPEQNQWTKVQSTNLKAPPFVEERLILACVLALSLFSMCFMLHPQSASASGGVSGSCSSNHCYGSNAWSGHMYGAYTSLGVRGVGGGNGFTLNGLWVIDTNTGGITDCRVNQNSRIGYCWIEVEYKAFGSGPYSGTQRWVWADLRSNYFYDEHDYGSLNPGDYGQAVGLSITQKDSTTWSVEIAANVSSYTEQSTGNTMYADAIRIGMELSGTGGWSAPVAHFLYNIWIDSGGGANYQMNSGKKDPQTYPAYGNWANPPNNFNQGGDWYTCVQNAGC